MKKIFLLTLVLVFSFGMIFSQSITVTNPNSGDTWAKGSTKNITWTKSGSMDANVKVTLYDTSGSSLIQVMTMNTPNDGNYPWLIENSIPNGSYIVRVKTIDNEVFDDSDIFAINNTTPESGSITVTSPHSGDSWVRGTSKTITWTKSGSMDANVKITLYDTSGTTLIQAMTMNTSNDGSYSWTIENSITAGSYIVRVKTVDNAVYDDSDIFAITNFAVLIPTLRILPDLEIKSVYFTDALGGKIVARIKNNINLFNGNVALSYKVLPRGAEKTVTKNVELGLNEEKVISLFSKTRIEMGCSGIALRVKVDPANLISEFNEENNVKYQTVYASSKHDGKIEYVKVKVGGRYIDVAEGGQVSVGSILDIQVRVRNCGGTRIEDGKISVFQNFQLERKGKRRCMSRNELIGSKTGISLSSGIARTHFLSLRPFTNSAPDHCRTRINEITVKYECGESGHKNRNNVLKFRIR